MTPQKRIQQLESALKELNQQKNKLQDILLYIADYAAKRDQVIYCDH